MVVCRGAVAQSVERWSVLQRSGATQRSTDVGSIPKSNHLFTPQHKVIGKICREICLATPSSKGRNKRELWGDKKTIVGGQHTENTSLCCAAFQPFLIVLIGLSSRNGGFRGRFTL